VNITTRIATSLAILVGLLHCLVGSQPVYADEDVGELSAEEFSFDVEEFEKSPWSLDGYVQGNLLYTDPNHGSDFHRLASLGKDPEDGRFQGGLGLQAGLTYQRGPFKAYALSMMTEDYSGDDWTGDAILYEGNLSLQLNPNVYFTLGKTLLRWGKGYAWTPTNFVARDKSPSDPDLALEGYWLGLAEFVKSFPGPLKTLAFTGVILPVSDGVNGDFGQKGHIDVAGKLYLLLYDTDIDIIALSDGSRTASYGLTASRNLTTNLEIHGELALVTDFERKVVDVDGTVAVEEDDAWSYLIGLRYLAPTDTTFIVEYFHNGKGYSGKESGRFFDFVNGEDDARLAASRPSITGYQRPHFMQNYLYLKASQKEPFGWLYVAPSLFTIVNLDDGSFSLTPEVTYTKFDNLELRFRLSYLDGSDGSEYGEKASNWLAELRVRYFF
jgi:hypothetical protein